MDRYENPFTPGAGAQPPALIGRDAVMEKVLIDLKKASRGAPTKSHILIGLRGVGKTVLLERIRREADSQNRALRDIWIEVTEGQDLPTVLATRLKVLLTRLSFKHRVGAALRTLMSFARAWKVSIFFDDPKIDLRYDPNHDDDAANSGVLEHDLFALLRACGKEMKKSSGLLTLFVDELQYIPEVEFGALIAALHGITREGLPVTMVAAGLPLLRGMAGSARTYAERSFDFTEIANLKGDEAHKVLQEPAQERGVSFNTNALDHILAKTACYPYFLQEWGKQAWDIAAASPISIEDAKSATTNAIAVLDSSFFRVRFDRLTPSEKKYLRAMAECGEEPRSGEIAEVLQRDIKQLAPTRSSLIKKGMAWSPAYGETAFTVPLFGGFMKRIMPGDEWLS